MAKQEQSFTESRAPALLGELNNKINITIPSIVVEMTFVSQIKCDSTW